MNTTMKAIIWVVVLGVVAWAGYALLGSQPAMPVEEEVVPVAVAPIKVGVIAPLTGEAATYGEPMRNVIEIAINEINAQGGVNGAQLIPIYEDDKCTGEGGASATQKLVNVDGVKIIIGSACSGATLAAVPVAEAGQVALFSPAASSPDLTGKSRFFSRDYPSDSSQGIVLADAAYTIKKWKKVAVIQEQKDYPLGIFKAFEAQFKSLGGTVVREEFAPSATDFRSILAKLKAAKPDALFIIVQASPSADRILKQFADLKWKMPLIVNDIVPGDVEIVKNQAKVLEGAISAEFPVGDNDKLKTLAASYKAKYGIDVPYMSYGQTEYDAVYIVRDALMGIGNDGAKIADWLKGVTNWQGASGSVTICADGDRVGGHVLKVIKDGKVELYAMPVAAADAATTTPKQ